MTIDLAKLTPAPWHSGAPAPELCRCRGFRPHSYTCYNVWADEGTDVTNPCAGLDLADAEFIALARNAFDVILRRGWSSERGYPQGNHPNEWCVRQTSTDITHDSGRYLWFGDEILWWPDPFTALVEADKWYAANVEGKEATA